MTELTMYRPRYTWEVDRDCAAMNKDGPFVIVETFTPCHRADAQHPNQAQATHGLLHLRALVHEGRAYRPEDEWDLLDEWEPRHREAS